MNKKEQILKALENIINQRGELRAAGFAIDSLPADFNKIIDAAWSAYYNHKGSR